MKVREAGVVLCMKWDIPFRPMKPEDEDNADGGMVQGMSGEAAR